MEGQIDERSPVHSADALVEKLNQNAFKGHFGVHWVERDDIIEYYVSGAMDAVDSAIFELEHFLNEKVISKFADENVWGFVCTSSAYRKHQLVMKFYQSACLNNRLRFSGFLSRFSLNTA